jgi:hypothetical protein
MVKQCQVEITDTASLASVLDHQVLQFAIHGLHLVLDSFSWIAKEQKEKDKVHVICPCKRGRRNPADPSWRFTSAAVARIQPLAIANRRANGLETGRRKPRLARRDGFGDQI